MLYRFDVRVHHRPAGLVAGPDWEEHGRRWATLQVRPAHQAEPMAISFDEALVRLEQLPGCAMEPDGALLWTGERQRWQIDGNLYDRGGRVVFLQAAGCCPPDVFDILLECLGWPDEPLMMEPVRASVFLGEAVFREHAEAHGRSS